MRNSSDIPRSIPLDSWGLDHDADGVLIMGGCSTVALADTFGTPLHVVDERRLAATAAGFRQALVQRYPAACAVHFAFKCNPVPGVIEIVRRAGLKAEVVTEHELDLALRLGFSGRDIVVNGPYKPDRLLETCLDNDVRFIVVDALEELEQLAELCRSRHRQADILLRINPNFVPSGMNQGSATGSRRGCAFGLDLVGGEVEEALRRLRRLGDLTFRGYHFHIGTGIQRPDDYRRSLLRLRPLVETTISLGFDIAVFDVGGGLGAATSREMTTAELLLYQGLGRLPAGTSSPAGLSFAAFAEAVTAGLEAIFPSGRLPELIAEPGRSIASSCQLLLLRVHRVKERRGAKKWLIADGGISTATMPTYYEHHEVLLCNDVRRPKTERVTIVGPACFAGDIVYRNRRMPRVEAGEVLAIMDSGAYFTAWESSFGFPRPAIVAAAEGRPRLLRRRETLPEMVSRDVS